MELHCRDDYHKNQTPPGARLNLIDLESDDLDWEKLEQGLYGKTSRSTLPTTVQHLPPT